MHNPHDDPPRFYCEPGDDGQYWIYDRDYERRAPQGPFYDGGEACEHVRMLNEMF